MRGPLRVNTVGSSGPGERLLVHEIGLQSLLDLRDWLAGR